MSIVLSYKFNTDVLGTDSSGSFLDMTNTGVTSVVDPTYGKVAYFDGSSYLTLASASTPVSCTGNNSRSISYWLKLDNASLGTLRFLYTLGNATGGTGSRWRVQHRIANTLVQAHNGQASTDGSIALAADTWYHIVNAFDTSDNTIKIYIDGTLDTSTTKSINTATNGMIVGGDIENLPGVSMIGSMTDFRIYDDILTPAEITTIFSTGPELENIFPTMYSHAANITWNPLSGASAYTLVTKNTSGDVTDSQTITTTEANVYNLDDGSTYDFELFSDLDLVTPVYESLANSTPNIDVTSANDLIVFVSNDLTQINESNISEIDPFIKDSLTTGDMVQARISFQNAIQQDKTLTFVEESGTINISGEPSVLMPFVVGNPSSDVTLELTNLSTEAVSFDEVNNQVTVQSMTYDVGDTFILDGKKVRVSELN